MHEKVTSKSWIEYDVLPKELEFSLLHYFILWKMKPAKEHTFKMYGRECVMHRLQRVYGQDYKFSGVTHKALPIPDLFSDLIIYFNEKNNRNYNLVLVNWYRDGNDYISLHADNEKQITDHSEIVTVSLGCEREFVIKNNKTNLTQKLLVSDNHFLTMGGMFQDEFTHGISKNTKLKDDRISITLRECC